MTTGYLFCGSPLHPRRVDEYFAEQAELVRSLGVDVALLDHDALTAGDVEDAVRRVPDGAGPLWYRGWMVSTASYRALAAALERRGASLVVTPDRYAAAHELPGWYDTFVDLTPQSVWTRAVPPVDVLARLVEALGGGPGIVKDYVKSRKDEWETACFVPDVADTAGLYRIVSRFVELQGDYLAGGVVVRAFERFVGDERVGVDGRAAEARVWWLDGAPVLVSPHPDTPDVCPEVDLMRIRPAVESLGCRFVTTDVALRADGEWRVVEVGDGQVSDLARGVDPSALFAKLVAVRAR